MIRHLLLSSDNRVLGIINTPQENTVDVEISETVYNDMIENGHDDYSLENGQLAKKINYIEMRQRRSNMDDFRFWRAHKLARYDLLRQCALNGDIDPVTLQAYPAITEAEKQWRVAVLNFTDQITHETTEADYPVPSERLR